MSAPARQRRQTLLLLELARRQSPILLDADVEMTAVVAHRSATATGAAYISYIVHAAARAIATYPEANAAVGGRRRPRLARYDRIAAKVTFDKTIGGVRAVVSGIVADADRATLSGIDEQIRRYKDADVATAPEFASIRALHRLPWPLAAASFRAVAGRLGRRPEFLGTFSVSSLGHRAVGGVYPQGGTALTFGVGHIRETPVVRDGAIGAAPVLRLGLVFDHRVIDGALAADILHDIKARLESWPPPPAVGAVPERIAERRAAAQGLR